MRFYIIYYIILSLNQRRFQSLGLHLFSFKSPTKWAEMNETGAADCAFTSYAMRNGVKYSGSDTSEELKQPPLSEAKGYAGSKGTAFRNSSLV